MSKKRKTKAENIEQHKIAVLLSLLLDYAGDFPEVVEICENVIDDLYENVEDLRKNTYFQELSAKIEERVAADNLMLGLLTIMALIEAKANSEKAMNLIKALEKMCNKLPQVYTINDLNEKKEKLNTVMRKNYEVLLRKKV